MQGHQPKYAKIILISIGVILLLLTGLHWFVKHKAVALIETALPNTIALTYGDLSISTIGRSLAMEEVSIRLKDSLTQKNIGAITIEDLEFKHFGVLDYFFNETLSLGRISISNVNGYLIRPDSSAKHSTNLLEKLPVTKTTVTAISLEHLSFQLKDPKTDAVIGSIIDANLTVDDVNGHLDPDNLALSYGNYSIKTDSINIVLGPLNTLRLKAIDGTNENTSIASVNLKTKYSPTELSRHLAHEEDYYNIAIPRISATNIPKSFRFDELPISIGSVTVEQPKALIYRDKLLADDLSIKPMLSEQLRAIPIPFHIEHFKINEAQLTYQERVHAYNAGGALTINKSTITIKDLSNTTAYQPLSIDVVADFAGNGKIKAHWEFDVLNENDDFLFTADASSVDLSSINAFSHPNFNAEMEGSIKRLYYTISGNKYRSQIDIKSNHENVKITVFDKSHNHRNKFFSSVANLIISKNSKNHKSDYKEIIAHVERDVTKSTFNYIFKNVKVGMTKIFL